MSYSKKEAMQLTGVSERSIFRWISDGKLTVEKNEKGRLEFSEENIQQIYEISSRGDYQQISQTIISVTNNKGGVGKTTSVINIAYEWRRMGYNVLAVDCDPQANLTDIMADQHGEESIYDFLKGKVGIRELIDSSGYFDILVSDLSLSGLEIDTDLIPHVRDSLHRGFQEINDYDIIIIDTPPSLGILTQMALVASDYIVIPVQASFIAMEGMTNLNRFMKIMTDVPGFKAETLGVVITMYDKREAMSRAVASVARREQGDLVCDTLIRRNRALDNSQADMKPVALYAPQSFGAVDYTNLAIELISRVKSKQT